MNPSATFTVSPELARLLGNQYSSVERALKELVDNAWDAESERVEIFLPSNGFEDRIEIRDFGSGMTTKEVEAEYLAIASSRFARRGMQTPLLKRKVKGRKGIGKFSGLTYASRMRVSTVAQGKRTSFEINRNELERARATDLGSIPIAIEVEDAPGAESGTTVVLTDLNPQLLPPSKDVLASLLIYDYGREKGFDILINDDPLSESDVPGKVFNDTIDVEGAGYIKLTWIFTDSKRPKGGGLVIKVQGKVVGAPDYLGLRDDPEIPPSLAQRIYGTIEADGLADDVTADWEGIVKNSRAYQQVLERVRIEVKRKLIKENRNIVALHEANLRRKVEARLAKVPEHRRAAADAALRRVFSRFYEEDSAKVETIANLVLDGFEKDDYWAVLKDLGETAQHDIAMLASLVQQFALIDMALVGIAVLEQVDVA